MFFKAQLDHFADTLHEGIEILGLRMTTVERGNGGHIIALFVLLD